MRIFFVYAKNPRKCVNKICGRNANFLNVQTGVILVYSRVVFQSLKHSDTLVTGKVSQILVTLNHMLRHETCESMNKKFKRIYTK
jgi:hypothetical protein